jgi:hypothetical protein
MNSRKSKGAVITVHRPVRFCWFLFCRAEYGREVKRSGLFEASTR